MYMANENIIQVYLYGRNNIHEIGISNRKEIKKICINAFFLFLRQTSSPFCTCSVSSQDFCTPVVAYLFYFLSPLPLLALCSPMLLIYLILVVS